jgi:hypothetical protein
MNEEAFRRRFDIHSSEEVREAFRLAAVLSETTLLPDGSAWSPSVDMRRFTDPNYSDSTGAPAFWRSADRFSPAYDPTRPAPESPGPAQLAGAGSPD